MRDRGCLRHGWSLSSDQSDTSDEDFESTDGEEAPVHQESDQRMGDDVNADTRTFTAESRIVELEDTNVTRVSALLGSLPDLESRCRVLENIEPSLGLNIRFAPIGSGLEQPPEASIRSNAASTGPVDDPSKPKSFGDTAPNNCAAADHFKTRCKYQLCSCHQPTQFNKVRC